METKNRKSEKAVAILYDKEKADAPQVVASGRGIIAQKIIETAREAGVHIQQDPDLAEILSKVPLGEEIPPELYQTIAEVLAFVYQMNNKFREKMTT